MKVFSTRSIWLCAVLVLSVPWILLGMPMFENNIYNGAVFGGIGYLINFKINPSEPSRWIGGAVLAAGSLIAMGLLVSYGFESLGGLHERKYYALAGAFIGWGFVELSHAILKNRTSP